MRIPASVLRRAGVDPLRWHAVARNPYGACYAHRPARPQWVRLNGGPLDGATLTLYDPHSGTLPLRGGRYLPPASGQRELTESPHWLIWHASREGA